MATTTAPTHRIARERVRKGSRMSDAVPAYALVLTHATAKFTSLWWVSGSLDPPPASRETIPYPS
jgi:hypothetical protein